jgi:hypothetical protein
LGLATDFAPRPLNGQHLAHQLRCAGGHNGQRPIAAVGWLAPPIDDDLFRFDRSAQRSISSVSNQRHSPAADRGRWPWHLPILRWRLRHGRLQRLTDPLRRGEVSGPRLCCGPNSVNRRAIAGGPRPQDKAECAALQLNPGAGVPTMRTPLDPAQAWSRPPLRDPELL